MKKKVKEELPTEEGPGLPHPPTVPIKPKPGVQPDQSDNA